MENVNLLDFIRAKTFDRTFVTGLNKSETERLIQRTRQRLTMGQSEREICEAFKHLPAHEVFFAVKAARIMDAP